MQANRRRKNLNRIRYWLDKALEIRTEADFYALALAADGLQKVNEDELAEARFTFTKCQELVASKENDDERYVFAFCQLWLTISDHNADFNSIKRAGLEAHSARKLASRFFRILLPLSSVDRLEEVCGDRKSPLPSLNRSAAPEGAITSKINFDF